jgi:hypothetical protein
MSPNASPEEPKRQSARKVVRTGAKEPIANRVTLLTNVSRTTNVAGSKQFA